jgi:hypothetical protein
MEWPQRARTATQGGGHHDPIWGGRAREYPPAHPTYCGPALITINTFAEAALSGNLARLFQTEVGADLVGNPPLPVLRAMAADPDQVAVDDAAEVVPYGREQSGASRFACASRTPRRRSSRRSPFHSSVSRARPR